MTEAIAISAGGLVIYWSSIVICLAVASWFCLSMALYVSAGGRRSAMWVLLPIACALSLVFSRFIHWYCHTEIYGPLSAAFTNFSLGSYCLPGVLLGVSLAVLLVRLLRFSDSAAAMFDALAPGAALGFALIRLSALFNNSCRGKIVVTTPALQRLPIAAAYTSSSGTADYRFATFFVQFLLLLLLTAILLGFFYKGGRRPMKTGSREGHTALLFLLLYSAMEIVLDSTRYDSSFLRSNGFVSLVQIISALCMLGVMVVYSVRSIRVNSLRFYHWLCWIFFLGSAGGVGYMEYLVQRHGDWYLKCYGAMTGFVLLMSLMVWFVYLSVRIRRKDLEDYYEEE